MRGEGGRLWRVCGRGMGRHQLKHSTCRKLLMAISSLVPRSSLPAFFFLPRLPKNAVREGPGTRLIY